MSAHPKGRNSRSRRPAALSKARRLSASHRPPIYLVADPNIVTNKRPIPLIWNNFVSRKLEVGLVTNASPPPHRNCLSESEPRQPKLPDTAPVAKLSRER